VARELTIRQAAVLAAIERHGGIASLPRLREDFQAIMPGAVLRVMEALERRSLVARFGDDEQVYLGGVAFVALPRREQ
jgi:hypothetical protein